MELRGKRVLVVGLGKSGVAASKLLLREGARVIGNDLRARAELGAEVEALAAEGLELALGGHDAALFTSVDHIVVSPGVPALAALEAADARGVPVSSEVELASWFVRGRVLAITGTNGKSTVTSLVGDMCARSGTPTFVGGNLGTPLVDVVGSPAAGPGGYVVVETSSYQLERVREFRAHGAAFLNLTPDHLDRYPSMEAYGAAKARIFERQTPSDFAVVPTEDPVIEAYARATRGRVLRFGPGGDARVEDGALVAREFGFHMPISELRIVGKHNESNALAAALVALGAGVPAGVVRQSLEAFGGLAHRMVLVRTLGGVTYYDDSKATNVGATVAALEGLRGKGGRVVLLAGGRDKGGSYAPLRDALQQTGRAVVLFGEAAPLLERALEGSGLPLVHAANLDAAVKAAAALAQPGDAVLLAPACSSFDMFRSYAERGDVFQAAVRALSGEGEGRP